MKEKNIVLISPKVIKARAMPCLGITYIASYLEEKGCNVRIVDSNFTKEDPFQLISKENNLIVGIACESKNFLEALDIAKFAKEKGHLVIMGGLHISLIKEKVMEYNCVDYAIHGDGELSLFKLLLALEGKEPFDTIPGLIYRHNGRVIINKQKPIINLDQLPFPNFSLAKIEKIDTYPIITSRDCPYECTYCTVGAISHGKWRHRTPKNIVAELAFAKQKYDIKSFVCLDENFSFDIERVKIFCISLLKANIKIPWSIIEGLRCDKVDRELLKLLKMSGCHHIIFGIEATDKTVFENISKGERLDDIKKAINLASQEGLKVGGYFVVGLPNSTFKTDMKSLRFAKRHKLSPVTFWMAIPYYDTKLYKWILNNAKLLREPIGKNLVNSLSTEPFFETKQYSEKKIKRMHAIANLRTGIGFFLNDVDSDTTDPMPKNHLKMIKYILKFDLYFFPIYFFQTLINLLKPKTHERLRPLSNNEKVIDLGGL